MTPAWCLHSRRPEGSPGLYRRRSRRLWVEEGLTRRSPKMPRGCRPCQCSSRFDLLALSPGSRSPFCLPGASGPRRWAAEEPLLTGSAAAERPGAGAGGRVYRPVGRVASWSALLCERDRRRTLQQWGKYGRTWRERPIDRERRIGCGTYGESDSGAFAIGRDKVASVIRPDLATTRRTCAAEAVKDCCHFAIAEVDE